MVSILRAIRHILNGYFKTLQVLVTVLMGLMIVPVSLQIFSRYTGFIPRYIWTEEAARFCFIWIILLGATIAVREGTHFEVDVLPTPQNHQRRSDHAADRLHLSCSSSPWSLSPTDMLTRLFGYNQTSELTGINMIFIHGVYLLAGISWLLFLGERVLWALAVIFLGNKEAIAHLRGDHNVAR